MVVTILHRFATRWTSGKNDVSSILYGYTVACNTLSLITLLWLVQPHSFSVAEQRMWNVQPYLVPDYQPRSEDILNWPWTRGTTEKRTRCLAVASLAF
jgi:hypothetical protein